MNTESNRQQPEEDAIAPPSSRPDTGQSDAGQSNSGSADDAEAMASSAATEEKPRWLQYQLRCPQLPLAVYREVATHLRQLDAVETGLLPQTSTEFDYLQSQVGGLWVRYLEVNAETCQRQIEAILEYYGERYRPWETINRQ
ncbi:MAG: hypothetical protein AAF773_17065 [Cyanobacteria bacterium P01_D01_bin.115]